MSSKRGPARTLHPQALSDIGEGGVIPPAEYDQRYVFGYAERPWSAVA